MAILAIHFPAPTDFPQLVMSDKGKAKADESPPPYPHTQDQLPPYENGEPSTWSSCAAYRPFPPVINAYASWAHWQTIKLCGANPDDYLYLAEVYLGMTWKSPLWNKPGVMIRNGTSKNDPVVAAAGDESAWAARVYAFNVNTIIMIPPWEPGTNSGPTDMGMMRGEPSGEHDVVFRFRLEAGEKMLRENFEWRKFKKGAGDDAKKAGFKLVRLFSGSRAEKSGDGGTNGQEGSSAAEVPAETVAVLNWGISSWTSLHLFQLELLGSAGSGSLGDRCVLAIVVTAVRIYTLHLNGRTTKTTVAVADKIGPKAK